jgi:hypothetical protein
VIGTSAGSGAEIIDAEGKEPAAVFVRNVIDFTAGNSDLIAMRTKGLTFNPLDQTSAFLRAIVGSANMYGVPLLVALAGLGAWRLRVIRRKRIKKLYAGTDPRDKEA